MVWASGTKKFSSTSRACLSPAMVRSGTADQPGAPGSAKKPKTRLGSPSVSVRAVTSTMFASWAFGTKACSPLSDHPPSARSAMNAGLMSLASAGFHIAVVAMMSPRAKAGRSRFACSASASRCAATPKISVLYTMVGHNTRPASPNSRPSS